MTTTNRRVAAGVIAAGVIAAGVASLAAAAGGPPRFIAAAIAIFGLPMAFVVAGFALLARKAGWRRILFATGVIAAGVIAAGVASLAAVTDGPPVFIAAAISIFGLPMAFVVAGFALLARKAGWRRILFATGVIAAGMLAGVASLAAADYLLFPIWEGVAELFYLLAAAAGFSRAAATISAAAVVLVAVVCGLLVGVIACGVRIGLAWDRRQRKKDEEEP